MATTIATVTGTTAPTQYASQCKIDRTVRFATDVLWAALLWDSDDTLRFYQSSNSGASWAEDVSARISGIDIASGASLRLDRGKPDGEEVLWLTYVTSSDFKLRLRRGRFGSTPTTVTWSEMTTSGGISLVVADGAGSVFSDLAVCSGIEGVHIFYTGSASKNLYWRYAKHASDSRRKFSLSPQVLVQGGSLFNSYPSCDVRHSGDDNQFLNGDVYVGYCTTDPEPTERHRIVRVPAKGIGSYDAIGVKQNVLSDDSVQALSCMRFDGDYAVLAAVPADAPTTVVMHEMNGGGSAWRTRNPPAPNAGNLHALALSWDSATKDPYIVVAGATDGFPRYTFYDRSADAWAAWAQINSDVIVGNSLDARPGSQDTKRIDLMYAVVNSTNRNVRHERIVIGNTPPSAPSWETESGYIDHTIPTTLALVHFDADGDAQTAVKLRRSVNGGAIQYYTGTAWQAGETSFALAADADGVTRIILSAANNGADTESISYTAATSDGTVFGPYGPALVLVGSTPVNPVITVPANLATVTAGRLSLTWTATEQTAWHARILDAGNAQLHDNLRAEDGTERGPEVINYQLEDATVYKVGLRTYNDEGIASAEIISQFTTAWALPPAPTYTVMVDDEMCTIDLTITNLAPGGGQVAAVSNRVYRAPTADLVDLDQDDLNNYELVAVDVELNTVWIDQAPASAVEYRYRVVAVSANYTTVMGA
jgi:hypothetical protein